MDVPICLKITRSDILIIALPADAEHTGSWDSLHVFECQERGRSAKYKLTSTVMLVLKSKTTSKSEGEGGKGGGNVALSGSMTRQVCPSPCDEGTMLME